MESNWDRYEESEKQEPDDGMPTRRGTDYHVLLESAGELRPPAACSLFDFVSFRRLLARTVTNHKNCVCTNMAHFVRNGKTSQD